MLSKNISDRIAEDISVVCPEEPHRMHCSGNLEVTDMIWLSLSHIDEGSSPILISVKLSLEN